MKTGILVFLSIIVGYIAGVFLPAYDFFYPKKVIEFETDYTIEAGTTAYSRFFEPSEESAVLPIEIKVFKNKATKIKLAPASK